MRDYSALILPAVAYLVLLVAPSDTAAEGQSSAVKGKTQPAPGRSATLAPQVCQPVVKINVAVGQHVKKDQLLIQLDDEDAQATLRQKKAKRAEAQAALDQVKAEPHEDKVDAARAAVEQAVVTTKHAKERRDRLKPLAAKGVIAEKDYEKAEAEYQKALQEERAVRDQYNTELHRPWRKEIAEKEAALRGATAELEAATRALDDFTIKAPIDGVVSWLHVDLGTMLRPGTGAWGQVLDTRELDVRCDVAPKFAHQLRVGQKATVTAQGDEQLQAEGQIVAVGVTVDDASGKVPVLVRIPNPDGRFLCNLPVRVTFSGQTAAK